MAEWKPDVCVYHGGCDDGFGAAWVVRKRYGDAVQFVPGNYSGTIQWPELAGKHVLFVDFSLKRDQMIQRFARRGLSVFSRQGNARPSKDAS